MNEEQEKTASEVTVPDDLRQMAEQRAERIRGHLESAAEEYALAVEERDWETLGCASVQDWADEYLGEVKFKPEVRGRIAELLTAKGFTYRQVGIAAGVSAATIAGDLKNRVQGLNTGNAVADAARKREQVKRGITYTEDDPPAMVVPAWTVTFSGTEFLTAIGNVRPFMGGKNSPMVTRCVHVRSAGGVMIVEATLGYMLARQLIRCDGEAEFYIGEYAVRQLAGMTLEKDSGLVLTGDKVIIGCENSSLSAHAYDPGKYPDTDTAFYGQDSKAAEVTVAGDFFRMLPKTESVSLAIAGDGKAMLVQAGAFLALVQPRRLVTDTRTAQERGAEGAWVTGETDEIPAHLGPEDIG